MTSDKHAQHGGKGEAGAGVERELKFIADRKTLQAAAAAPFLGGGVRPPAWRELLSVYFDDDDGALSLARVALRMRRSKDGWVMGLKRAAPGDRGAFEREETEVGSPSGEPDLSLFDKDVAREVTDLTGGKPLAPQFGSDIRRAARTVETKRAAIEVAFDKGFLFAGERRAPTAEIELELKSGAPAALFDLGLELVEAFPVRLGLMSKAERAHALMSARPPEPAYAQEPSLRLDTTVDEAIAAVMRNCLAHFLGNLPALEAGDAVEAVHQMRVAIRRLTSAVGLFGRAVPSAEFEALRMESKRIATVLGEARNWDVFVKQLGEGGLACFAAEPGFDLLFAAAKAKAAETHKAVAELARDKAVARFALSLERLAAAQGWRDGASDEQLAMLDQPIGAVAARWLETLHRKLRRRGRHFRSLTPEARHRLRIAIKHMRYATEFFGGLFPSKSAAKRYAGKVAALQDLLGDSNDAVIALNLVKALGPARSTRAAYAAGLVTGWLARQSAGDGAVLRRAWRDLVEATPFWGREGGDRQVESA